MLYDLRIGLAGTSLDGSAPTLASATEARHRRFFRNRQRRQLNGDNKRQTEDPEAESESGEADGVDSASTADESQTQEAGASPTAGPEPSESPAIANPPPAPAVDETPKPLPATTPSPSPAPSPGPSPSDPLPAPNPSPVPSPPPASSPLNLTTALPAVDSPLPSSSSKPNSNPPVNTVPLPTRSRASIAPIVSKTSSTVSTVPLRPEATNIPPPTFQTSKSRIETFSTASRPVPSSPAIPSIAPSTVVLPLQKQQTQASNLAVESGAGSTMISGIRTPVDGKMVAGVVLGILGAAFIILFGVWHFMRARRSRAEHDDLEKPTTAQRIFGQSGKSNDSPHDDTNSVSRLWGGATTVAGGPAEPAYNQTYIPASVQRGTTQDEAPYNPPNFSRLPKPATSVSNVSPMPASPVTNQQRAAPSVDDNGLIQPPNRWFGRNSSVSMATIPRFRSIKSWAMDQRQRTEKTRGTEQWPENEKSAWSESGDSRDSRGSTSPSYSEK